MLRQLLLTYYPEQISTVSSRSLPSVWGRWASVPGGAWPLALADRMVGKNPRTSRLMAAVHTDIVGYSRLFALDNNGTVARLRTLRRSLIAPAIRRHHGQLVQTAGDSMLITFDSVVQAVKCAVAIQSELAIDNGVWPRDRQVHLRVGIDLGDIIADGPDFHGDGVIVAARLQAVCPPGGVCVSRVVHDRGGDRLGLRSEALGPLMLKNCSQPVEAIVLWPPSHEVARPKAIGYDSES